MMELRYSVSVPFLVSLLVCVIAAAPAVEKKDTKVIIKKILPVAIENPMGVATKKNAAKVEKLEEYDRKLLLGFVCFMEFGANNGLFRALNAGDKNKDGKMTIEEFNDYYTKSEELQAIVFQSKEGLFQMFDRNKDGLLSVGDTMTSSACDRAKEEKKVILPTYMEETFDGNLDAAMFIKNAGEFDALMNPIRKYILSLYDSDQENIMSATVINAAVWGACRNIKMGGVVNCEVLQLDQPNEMIIIRKWIKYMKKWSLTHPMR